MIRESQMTKILITGSQSFVGTNFRNHSKFNEIDEVALFNYEPGKINFSEYDVILHLVAIVHQKATIPEAEYFRVNRDLTLQIAREAKQAGVRQFIFLSTVKVYGAFRTNSDPWNESSACFPEDAYGRSKYEAEKALRALNDDLFTVSIIRTPLVYGEGVRANMASLVKLVKQSIILPFKGIHNKRNYTSAENLVAFIDRIIEEKIPGVFIAMDRKAISTTELVKMISENLDKKTILFKMPDLLIKFGMFVFPKFFDRLYGSYEMDNSKTLQTLDFEPPVTTREGIKRMIESLEK
jgi:nucleoside-diphosphate-sugar epimerase